MICGLRYFSTKLKTNVDVNPLSRFTIILAIT